MIRRLLLFLTSAYSMVCIQAMAQIDPKVAEFCIKAQDFAGCVETMTRGLPSKQAQDAADGLRTWTRDNGQIVRMRASNVVVLKKNGNYGRYIEYRYGLEDKDGGVDWIVQADCVDYTANWDQDNAGWYQVKDPDKYLRPGEDFRKYSSAREAKILLDEFCGKIDSLPRSGRDLSM
jgi:hypothetical protein